VRCSTARDPQVWFWVWMEPYVVIEEYRTHEEEGVMGYYNVTKWRLKHRYLY